MLCYRKGASLCSKSKPQSTECVNLKLKRATAGLECEIKKEKPNKEENTMAIQLIDTHSHIYEKEFENDITEVVERAKANGVYKILLANVDTQSLEPIRETCARFSGLYAMAGLHPTSVNENWESELEQIRAVLYQNRERFCAVGEIGLDFYWDRTFAKEQQEAFRTQMLWSEELNLPVSVHVRKAYDELFPILKDLNRKSYQGVVHCFGGDANQANKLIEMGFKLGIGGVLTFKNAHLVEIVRQLNLDNIVLETDAPYLAPVPFRGKRNESAYILNIAEAIAAIKHVTLEEVAEKTTRAVLQVFPSIV